MRVGLDRAESVQATIPGTRNRSWIDLPSGGIAAPAAPTRPVKITARPPIRAVAEDAFNRTPPRTRSLAVPALERLAVRSPAKTASTWRLGPGASRTVKTPSCRVRAVVVRSRSLAPGSKRSVTRTTTPASAVPSPALSRPL